MPKYRLEFILHTHDTTPQLIKDSIVRLGEKFEILKLPQDAAGTGEDFKINMYADDPTIIFDTCAQFGRIKSVKIDEPGG